ncbi:hypothetical protein Q5752_004920 [Cryptotrichosporon argae]
MTTSITDARFTHLQSTAFEMRSLLSDEPAETGWSVMPGYDEDVLVPVHLEPPRADADETLPTQAHPSYPLGRPGPSTTGASGGGPGALGGIGGRAAAMDRGRKRKRIADLLRGEAGDAVGWPELATAGIMRKRDRKEVPPGMAGAKRPPSPPSPALRPAHLPAPRSHHLRTHLERHRRHASPPPRADPFDGPVPNETSGDAPA